MSARMSISVFKSSQQGMTVQNEIKEVLFYLKLKNSIYDKVYIKYYCVNDEKVNFQQELMCVRFQSEDEINYFVKLKLNTSTTYKYQYVIEKGGQLETEQNFRTFTQKSGKNQVDEWNKVWCLYKVVWQNADFFDQYEIKIDRKDQEPILLTKSKIQFLTWDCQELLENDYSQKIRQFIFYNRYDNSVFQSNTFSATNGQSTYQNFIDWEFTTNMLPQNLLQPFKQNAQQQSQSLPIRQSIRRENTLETEVLITDTNKNEEISNLENTLFQNKIQMNNLQNKLQQIEEDREKQINKNKDLLREIEMIKKFNEIQLKDLAINHEKELLNCTQRLKDQNQMFQDQLNQLNQDKLDFEKFTSQAFCQYKQEIAQLQDKLCQSLIQTQITSQQIGTNQIKELEENNNILQSEELQKSYKLLEDSFRQLEQQKEDNIVQLNKQEKSLQTQKKKFEQLQSTTKQCELQIEEHKKKIEEYEEELLKQNKLTEKQKSTIEKVKKELQLSQDIIKTYKQQLAEVQKKLDQAEEENRNLSSKLQEQESSFEKQKEESQKQYDILKSESDKKLKETIEQQNKIKAEMEQKQIQQQESKKQFLIGLTKNYSDKLYDNVVGDFILLQKQFSQEIIMNLNNVINILIRDKLEFVKDQLSSCCISIQKLHYQDFDEIKKDSQQLQVEIEKLIRQGKQKIDQNDTEKLLKQLKEFNDFGIKISEIIKKTEDLDEPVIEDINKYLKYLDNTKDSIKNLVFNSDKFWSEQQKFDLSYQDLKVQLDREYNEVLIQIQNN